MPVIQESYQRKTVNISVSHFAFLSETPQLSGLPEWLEIYYSWCNHQMRFTKVHFEIKNAKFNTG